MAGVDTLGLLGASQWMDLDGERLQRALQRARYDLWGVASRRALAGDIAGGNAEVKVVVDTYPQMRGWVVVNPLYPQRSAEEMRRYAGSSRWLGAMLYAGHNSESLLSATTREVVNAYRRYTKPLLVTVPDEATVSELEAFAAEFSTVKIIAAGAGGDAWHACTLAAKKAVNLFLEPFSGGCHRGKVESMLEVLGPNRILFGSGFPQHNPGAALGLLLDARISDGERNAILTTNAVRLFNLRQSAEPEA